MHKPKSLIFSGFDSPDDPLLELGQTTQVKYMRLYLRTLGALSVIEEGNYFDRDYLDEFSSFYSLSSRGYPNICRRLHFFSSNTIDYDLVERAADSDDQAQKHLQDHYLGFSVIRPITATPIGRTVLCWFPDLHPATPRVTSPSREYVAHLAGLTLRVTGLAWQQQDTGVGACATIGLWTALHSSAFDDHHAVPTTAEITKAAHDGASLGARMFPSTGLTMYQFMEAIKAQKLAPIWCSGNVPIDHTGLGFSKERFSSTCASFLRSGYPVLIWGQHLPEAPSKHVICAVGFRETPPPSLEAGESSLQDREIEFLYIHDDNLGPNVRFKIIDNGKDVDGKPLPVTLKTDSPPQVEGESPVAGYPEFRPEAMCIAVHECIRSTSDSLHLIAKDICSKLTKALNIALLENGRPGISLSSSARFIKLADYMGEEIGRTLGTRGAILGRVRLSLTEKVPPMSLHIAVVRIALDDATPLLDLLYDTTDTDRNRPIFAHVIYAPLIASILSGSTEIGVPIQAF